MIKKMVNFDVESPSEAALRTINVHELLPQQEPFVMIGTLIHFDKTLTVTETEVQKNNIFVDDDRFSASGLMENIAQTCAARIGYVNKYILKKGIQLGFIGAVRNFEVKEEVFGMTLAEASITCGDKVLVTSEIKIAVKEQEEA